MPPPTLLPSALKGRIFSVSEAESHGLSRRVLQGRRVAMVSPGYYRYAEGGVTLEMAVHAALRVLPDDAALSHITNLRWRGFDIRSKFPLHFASADSLRSFRKGIVLHRYHRALDSTQVRGVPVLAAERTFVDCATMLSIPELIRVGDWLVAAGHADLLALRAFVIESHLDGVQRARRAAEFVREAVESPRETDVRVALVQSGLPEPDINRNIVDDRGRFLARGDMVYPLWRVLVEYDGWQHERDASQRQRDHLRREALEAEGWRVIVVTIADMRQPNVVASRVRQALIARGYRP